jgi:hypothetical protein
MLDMSINNVPIPARFMKPWVEDNLKFQRELKERKRVLDEAINKRDELPIRTWIPGSRTSLAAVDASVTEAPIGDYNSILIQVVRIIDDGTTILAEPIRLSGIAGMELNMARGPMRMAGEYKMLAESSCTTIADTSFWSGLWDINSTIGAFTHGGVANDYLEQAYRELITEQRFLATIRNPFVIAMSKSNQSHRYSSLASDREFLGQALQAGEFLIPELLAEAMKSNLGAKKQNEVGVEQRGFTAAEQEEIKDIYNNKLGITYFKPHTWARAFRIEAYMTRLQNDEWLMPLLGAIHHHTLTRTVEPWPQFMTDWTSKIISAVTGLYGMLNFHRVQIYDPARTLRSQRGYK